MVLPRVNEVEMDRLGGDGRDPESLDPLPRGFSWPRSWTAQTDRSGLNGRAASISSAVSHWSVQWIARWTPARRETPETQIPSIATLSESQNNFLVSILGELPQNEPQLQDACAWYIGYLEFKIRENWVGLLRNLLTRVDPLSYTPCNPDISAAFEMLKIVVNGLSSERVAITDLVDTLYNEHLLKETNGERTHAKQLVFVVFGWISTLYPAGFDPEAKTFRIINTSSGTSTRIRKSTKRQAPRHRIKTFAVYEQSLESNEDLDQPLHTLLGQFGRIIPQRNRQSSITGQNTPLQHVPPRPDEQWIELHLLCFRTLEKVAFIKLEWVDSLSLHLEFDKKTKVLKIYRLPSLCVIMSSCGNKLSPLSRIFWDADDSKDFFRPPPEDEDASDFHREILLSYRLIFSQSPTSSLPPIPTPAYPNEYHDALLPILCSSHWESNPTSRAIYEAIDEDPQSQYSPLRDFPYLGKRLLEVQRYVREQRPSGFWGLWYDKRDQNAWWALWAVIIIGGITVIITTLLGILQLAVGIMQVKYAKDQLTQQNLPSASPGG